MTQTLKPCPFCGGRAEVRQVTPYRKGNTNMYLGYFVLCSKCLTSSDNYNNEENAVRHWNNRINSD